MQIIKSVPAMRRLSDHWRRQAAGIGFVPTMGCLHAGHLSLVDRARRDVGGLGKVVVSIYVNPSQFGPKEDFSRYPRDLQRDARLCQEARVDAVFAPSDEEMYPGIAEGGFSTYIVEQGISAILEGRSRPTHFRGVATIVGKLFNIVQPQIAVFGAKDYQQAAIVQRMVENLNFPVRIAVEPTVRELDGLAMSSRNRYLEGDLRRQSTVLWRAILEAQAAVRSAPKGLPAARLKARLEKLINQEPDARLDSAEFFDPETWVPVPKVTRGAHLALAVFIGRTRLIDNARL
jgi:pantoate--beta-alanine ligase